MHNLMTSRVNVVDGYISEELPDLNYHKISINVFFVPIPFRSFYVRKINNWKVELMPVFNYLRIF